MKEENGKVILFFEKPHFRRGKDSKLLDPEFRVHCIIIGGQAVPP